MKIAYVITGYTLTALAIIACWDMSSAPAVVGVALLIVALTALLTAPFATMRFTGPGVSIEAAQAATRQLEQSLEEVAETTAPVIPEPADRAQPAFDFGKFLDRIQEKAAEQEKARRVAIEKFMTDAARWGYQMAGIGFKTPPRPVIQWSDDGKPTILYGEGEHSPVRSECLAYALKDPNLVGIWGGTTSRQRRELRAEGAA